MTGFQDACMRLTECRLAECRLVWSSGVTR